MMLYSKKSSVTIMSELVRVELLGMLAIIVVNTEMDVIVVPWTLK